MSDIIDFPSKKPKKPDNVITDAPMRLRWGDWRTTNILQVHVRSAAGYEDYRAKQINKGLEPGGKMPAHIALTNGLNETALAVLRHRHNQENLIKVGFLAALMETLVNTPCAILRTDLIRRVYSEVEKLSTSLNLSWRGGANRFMLPLLEDQAQLMDFKCRVAPLNCLNTLFETLDEIARERQEKLARQYVFYYPRGFTL